MTGRVDIAEVYRGDDGQFYWRILAGNKETIAQGEGYANKVDLLGMLAKHFPQASIVDLTAK